MLQIIQIVPRLPPYTDGVGDYALRLASQLEKDYQIKSHFLVFQSGNYPESTIEGFPLTVLAAHNQQAFLEALPDNVQAIICQYSNYPYLRSKLDAPFWLINSLRLAQEKRHLKLIMMYHELPFLKWQNLRLLNPIQSLASRRLSVIADAVFTNDAQFQAIISNRTQKQVLCLPNFSGIGEPETIKPLKAREKRLIVFGGPDRIRVYQNSLSDLLKTCQILGIIEVYDIGKSLNLHSQYQFPGINLTEMGFQPAAVVSKLLSESFFCCFDYSRFAGNLGKSSVLAACCAHGTVPIATKYNPSEADGLVMNKHYLVLGEYLRDFSDAQLQAIATHGHQWYLKHSLKENTKLFASFLLKE